MAEDIVIGKGTVKEHALLSYLSFVGKVLRRWNRECRDHTRGMIIQGGWVSEYVQYVRVGEGNYGTVFGRVRPAYWRD